MKKRPIFLMMLMVIVVGTIFIPNSHAVTRTQFWSKMCASCHDGKTALSKEAIRDKYLTVSAFSEAVLNKGGRCMNILKNDKKMIRKVAIEIGLQ